MTAETPSRSSLLFAMGKLTAEVEGHKDEIGRLREEQGTLPERIAAQLAPQFLSLTTTQSLHGERLTQLERRQWLFMGGSGLVAIVAPLAIAWLRG